MIGVWLGSLSSGGNDFPFFSRPAELDIAVPAECLVWIKSKR